ncbi:MAG: hypothetical protein SFV15_17550 [Polyangiaceae bacterium]|nr:hypothetical protein [Polyangiaceae bacterium]
MDHSWRILALSWVSTNSGDLQLGFYSLMARLTSRSWALLGMILLVTNHTFLCRVANPVAHMPVAALFTWGCALLLAWEETGTPWRIALAGFLFGAIPAVRYPDSVLLVGPFVYLLRSNRWGLSEWPVRRIALSSFLVPVALLLLRNQVGFGAFWRTGYSISGEQSALIGPWFWTHLVQYSRLLLTNGLGPVFVAGVMGMLFMLDTRPVAPFGALALPAATAQVLVYAAYYWAPPETPEDTMRFIMPTFPLYFAAAGWLLWRSVQALNQRIGVLVIAVAVALQASWQGLNGLHQFRLISYQTGINRVIEEAVRKYVPAQSLVLAHPTIEATLEYFWNWKLVEPGAFLPALDEPMVPEGVTVPFEPGRDRSRLRRFLEVPVAKRGSMLAKELRKWSGRDELYVISQGNLRLKVEEAFAPIQCSQVASIPLPPVPWWPRSEGHLGAALDAAQPAQSEGSWDQELRAGAPPGLIPTIFLDFLNVRNPLPIYRCALPK